MALTNLEISNAKGKEKDYKLTDGKGLFLLVKKNGSKYWRWNYRYAGKQKTLALGVYPEISAKAARAKRDNYRLMLSDGSDPREVINERKATKLQESQDNLTMGEALERFRDAHSVDKDDKTVTRVESLIRLWVKPKIGKIPCKDIKAHHVLDVVRDIEKTDMRPTAHKVATLLKQCFAYCISEPDIPIDRNWMLDVISLLKPLNNNHHPALITPQEVAKLLVDVRYSKSYWLTQMAIRLSLHWFIRPGEIRRLLWSEVNWDTQCVQLSADRMKKTSSTQDHWIPMSKQTKEVLKYIEYNNRPSIYVFPSIRNLSKPMSENTVNGAIRKMGYVGKQTAHGLRATARTLLDEELKQNPNYIEHQLAHKVKDANGRAYNRTTQLNERRVMLQLWSDYLDDLEYKAMNDIPILTKYEDSLKENK